MTNEELERKYKACAYHVNQGKTDLAAMEQRLFQLELEHKILLSERVGQTLKRGISGIFDTPEDAIVLHIFLL